MNRKTSILITKSLGFRVLKTLITTIVIILSVYTFFFVFRECRNLKEEIRHHGETHVNVLAQFSKLGIFSENVKFLEDIVKDILNHNDVASVSIFAADLKALYVANKKTSRKLPDRGEGTVNKEIVDKLTTSQSLEVIETRNTFEFVKPVVMETFPNETLYFDNKSKVKTEKIIGYVRIVFDKGHYHNKILSILLNNIIIAMIFMASSIVIMYLAVKKYTGPLEKLSEHVRKLGMGENFGKVSIESKDEIGRLANTFNEMSENLKKREEEKQLLEENLANAKKMEAVGTLARGLAHDFNNILAIVQGSVYILKNKLGDDNPLQKYTLQIYKSTMRAKDLIQALLIFSRTQKIHLEIVDINAVVKEMNPIPVSENTEYIETLTDEPLRVMADRLKIEQVIMNIISNAQDAMPGGGRLFIKTEVAHIDTEDATKKPFKKPGNYALVSISDTGIGMSKETKERIFEPFFTTKKIGKGTGIGLSIVYGIIEEHAGYIDVDTQEDGGTTFKIYLPIAGNNNM